MLVVTMFGADTIALRAVAGRFRERGDDTAQGVAELDRQILAPAWWWGPNADAVQQSWSDGTAPRLVALADTLAGLADELERRAAQQDVASDAARGGGPGGGLPDAFGGAPREAFGAGLPASPTAPATPEQRREVWNALTPEEQAALIDADPFAIGQADGVPLDVRADANQAYARQILEERAG